MAFIAARTAPVFAATDSNRYGVDNTNERVFGNGIDHVVKDDDGAENKNSGGEDNEDA